MQLSNASPSFGQESGSGPWSNVYGTARSMLGVGTLLTLVFNPTDSLFRPFGRTLDVVGERFVLARWGLFALAAPGHLELARWVAVVVLLLVLSGWRPRVTGVLHWYVTFSYAVATFAIDGGDQVTANLALLLVPVTLTDGRRSHWDPPGRSSQTLGRELGALLARSAWIVIRIQVCAIYAVAGISKMKVPEWVDGTALYYWFTDPTFGTNGWVASLVTPLIRHPVSVVALTWSVLLLELCLAASLIGTPFVRRVLLPLGLGFHLSIVLVHGLASFFCAMAAALVLYLRPPEETFTAAAWRETAASLWAWLVSRRSLRGAVTVPAGAAECE